MNFSLQKFLFHIAKPQGRQAYHSHFKTGIRNSKAIVRTPVNVNFVLILFLCRLISKYCYIGNSFC